jgi:3-hydroxybutyrate dehydrogenase
MSTTPAATPPLQQRRAVVTGASRGIGRAIALALAAAGADVALTARNQADLEQVAAEVQALGRRALIHTCDVTNPTEVGQMAAAAIAGLGGVDILVNDAGISASHRFLDHPDEAWHAMLAINLTGIYYVTKAIIPTMVAQNYGRIINIASIAAKIGARYLVAYSTTKHGVIGLTRSLAAEFVSNNITVNAICPGYVDTPMTERSVSNIMARTGMSEEKARAALTATTPQQRLIESEEVADLTVFLALENSKGITGQAINVDGGAVMY